MLPLTLTQGSPPHAAGSNRAFSLSATHGNRTRLNLIDNQSSAPADLRDIVEPLGFEPRPRRLRVGCACTANTTFPFSVPLRRMLPELRLPRSSRELSNVLASIRVRLRVTHSANQSKIQSIVVIGISIDVVQLNRSGLAHPRFNPASRHFTTTAAFLDKTIFSRSVLSQFFECYALPIHSANASIANSFEGFCASQSSWAALAFWRYHGWWAR